ncbi:MAG: hypothetical protein WCO52_03550 [bacterium]
MKVRWKLLLAALGIAGMSVTMPVHSAEVDTPAITSPTSGTVVSTKKLVITASAYAGAVKQVSSQWQLDTVDTFDSQRLVTKSEKSHFATYNPPTLSPGTWYVRVRYKNANGAYSAYSQMVPFIVPERKSGY